MLARRAANAAAQSMRTTSPAAQTLSLRCTTKRFAHHEAPQYNEPSGHLFGQKPLPPGQKRKWEDWELIWYVGMFGGMAMCAIGLYFKPDTGIQTWALQEARRRLDASGEKYKYEPKSSS